MTESIAPCDLDHGSKKHSNALHQEDLTLSQSPLELLVGLDDHQRSIR